MSQFKVILALKAQAKADKAKALMSLELLTTNGVGIGDHTANDYLKDATESLTLLVDADDRLSAIALYFPEDNPIKAING
jgi:hypothetical protein|tara:strand:+ start:2039 stop:2278 length:240 start_codon:yes stop_codon:yes gene_type:complete